MANTSTGKTTAASSAAADKDTSTADPVVAGGADVTPLTETTDALAGADAQAAAVDGTTALPDAGPAPVDHRALTLSKQLQAAVEAHGRDVVEAAIDHAGAALDRAAEARRAAGVERDDVPQGRSATDVKTSR